jgi:hypothetical protein
MSHFANSIPFSIACSSEAASEVIEPFEGTDELADRLMPYFDPQVAEVHDLHQLLRFLYHASLIPEEGRHPRFRVICGREIFGHAVDFDEPWPGMNSVESIRRIASAISGPNTALRVVGSSHQGFKACQIIDFREHSVRGSVESIYRLSRETLPFGTLTVRIDGPGQLRASVIPGPIVHLKGGKIRELTAYDMAVLPFRTLVQKLSGKLQTFLQSLAFEPSPTVDALTEEVLFIWATMMSEVIGSSHGGAFILTPGQECPFAEPRFRAKCDLFRAFETSARWIIGTDSPSISELQKRWLLRREHIVRVAHMLGHLSATDGAVLFDQSLCMYGFGAKIGAVTPRLPLTHVPSGRLIEAERTGGMRHRSAGDITRSCG